MADFCMELAGRVVRIRSRYDEVYRLCRDYLTEAPADFTAEATEEDLAEERRLALREAALEGKPAVNYKDAYLETLAVYRKIGMGMLQYDTLLVHGSAVCADGEAYLFTAPSGTGKTTHTRLWLSEIPGSFVVNGDKPLIRLLPDRIEVCGTPWSGKEGLNRRVNVPLKAICFLERGKQNEISRTSFRETYPLLMQQCYRPTEPEAMRRTLELISRLGEETALYRLHCNMEPEAALVAYNGMVRDASD